MKKHILLSAILITAICATAYASMWDDEAGTEAGGTAEASIVVPTEVTGLKIILFKASDFPDTFKSDLFLTSIAVKYADKSYLKIKAFQVLDDEEKALLHSPNYDDLTKTEFCDNNTNEIINNKQEFDCTLTTGVNVGLSLSSKIKYKFYSSDGKFLAETSAIELKKAEGGKDVVSGLVYAVAIYNTAVNDAPFNPPKDYEPSDPGDADGDGKNDAADEFPSLSNNGSASPVTINADTDGDGIKNDVDNCPEVENADQADEDSDGIGDVCEPDYSLGDENSGGDCSLNAAAGVNGLGWIFDLLMLGIPAALFGFRRKIV